MEVAKIAFDSKSTATFQSENCHYLARFTAFKMGNMKTKQFPAPVQEETKLRRYCAL